MATAEDHLRNLEVRVDRLETWAGPGQAGALADGQRQLRTEVGHLRTEFATMRAEFTTMQGDLATMRGDFTTMRTEHTQMLQEILRRLPPPPSDN